MLKFIDAYRKKLEKLENVSTTLAPPEFWISLGNYAINYIVSGSFYRAIPQGRITCAAGPSGSGKSFLTCNFIRNAQAEGCFILYIDSEHAIDPAFLKRAGVNISPTAFQYVEADTFGAVIHVLSDFFKMYVAEYPPDSKEPRPRVMIVLDSIDMLDTDKAAENFESGKRTGDQGQRAKQQKDMLRAITHAIKRAPFCFLLTHQVYPNTDLLNGLGKWMVTNGLKYACSQIFMIDTPLKLKDGTDVSGIRMRVENYKSRFTMKGANIEVDVPFKTGLDKYDGILDIFLELGVITQGGAWYYLEYPGQEKIKFQKKGFGDDIFELCMKHPKIIESEAKVQDLMDFDPEDDVEIDSIADSEFAS